MMKQNDTLHEEEDRSISVNLGDSIELGLSDIYCADLCEDSSVAGMVQSVYSSQNRQVAHETR